MEISSVDEFPLHSGSRSRPLACDFPERPVQGSMYVDLRCRACFLACVATVKSGGDQLRRCYYSAAGTERVALLSQLLAERAAFHGLEHLVS